MGLIFYILATVAIISALIVVFAKNPVNSVIALIVTFLAIAGHYILLNAQFLAVVHIIVYTGAIMVLFLFVIMLLDMNRDNEPHKKWSTKLAAVISGGLFLLVLLAAIKKLSLMPIQHAVNNQLGMVHQLGQVLFKDFLLPFEATSVLFLAAMVGAMMLGKHDKYKI
ncbi:MAG: NADH-quinone oxidoreductase subunit J [Bacteroidota bacterium]|nr:NADH-quinone oxidoreductase subunit J [Bacteroidota bacterium]